MYTKFLQHPDARRDLPGKFVADRSGCALAPRRAHAEIIADRFVRATNAWVDLGTGLIVRLRAVALASAPEQLQWDMRCTTIARLRHPMLNRLMDYGSIGQSRFFEVYSVTPRFD